MKEQKYIPPNDFKDGMQRVLQGALNMNAIEGSIWQLRAVIHNPKMVFEKKFNPPTNLIDQRKQKRELKTLFESEEFGHLEKDIDFIKKINGWATALENTDIRRPTARTFEVVTD